VVVGGAAAWRGYFFMEVEGEVQQFVFVQPFCVAEVGQFGKEVDELGVFDLLGHLHLVAYLVQQLLLAMGLVGSTAHQHLEHDDAYGIEI